MFGPSSFYAKSYFPSNVFLKTWRRNFNRNIILAAKICYEQTFQLIFLHQESKKKSFEPWTSGHPRPADLQVWDLSALQTSPEKIRLESKARCSSDH